MTTKTAVKSAAKKAAETAHAPFHLELNALPALDGWDSLEKEEQDVVTAETSALDKALRDEGNARIAVGEHLYNIREVLEPKRVWNKFLLSITRFSRATAYRYISVYTAAKNLLPEPVMQAAMLRGMNRIDLDAVRELPPPRSSNVTVINEYLNELSNRPSAPREETYDPNLLKRECLNFVKLRYDRIPAVGRSRSAWLTSLIGMMLTQHGITQPTTITPVPIPESFKVARGRPAQKAAA